MSEVSPREYRRRIVDCEIDELAPPALALEGAKAVGKSATAAQRARTTFELDRSEVAAIVRAQPDRVVDASRPVLIDEWQRVPELWDRVRRAVDAGAEPMSFILTGSVLEPVTGVHSGAGRIIRVRMRPLSLAERGIETPTVSLLTMLTGTRPSINGRTRLALQNYVDEIVRSGFPAIREAAPRLQRAQLDGYIDRVIDMDFLEAGHSVRNPAALRRWMNAYAAASSTTASFDTLRAAATPGDADKPAKVTTQAYRDTLERLWIVEPLPAWLPTTNHLRELGAAPKHHLVDPALAARLLGLDAGGLLDGLGPRSEASASGTFLGALFESLLTLSVRVYAQAAEASVSHLRTHRGLQEVDLIVKRGDGKVVALETKLAATVSDADVRHLIWLRERVGERLLDAAVITTGTEAYRRPDGIAVIPAALLGP